MFKLIFSEQKYQKYILDVIFNIKAKSKIILIDTNLSKSSKYGKAGIVDLLLEFDGKKYALELQNQNRYNLEERLIFYVCKIYNDGLFKNEDYKQLNIVGILALINHDFKDNRLYDEHLLKSRFTSRIFSEKIDIRVCNLKEASKENNLDDKKIRLAKFIASTDLNELEMLATKDKVLNEILEKMKNYNKNEEAKKKMLLWDDNFESIERDRKRYIEVGKEEGRKEGRNEGRKEGISAGIKSVAINLLKNNAPIDLVMKSTGLSKKEINKLAINL